MCVKCVNGGYKRTSADIEFKLIGKNTLRIVFCVKNLKIHPITKCDTYVV